jgi:hypothetical protein
LGFNIVSITSLDDEVPSSNFQPYVSVKHITTQQRRKYKTPPLTTNYMVQFSPSPQETAHIRSFEDGNLALDTFLAKEPQPQPALPCPLIPSNTRIALIKRSSPAQAPTRIKISAPSPQLSPQKGKPTRRTPQSSPARPPRRPQSDLFRVIKEEGNPDKDSLPRSGFYASRVPPSSPRNKLGRDMIGIHFSTRRIVSPTPISLERYAGLHTAYSQGSHPGTSPKISPIS